MYSYVLIYDRKTTGGEPNKRTHTIDVYYMFKRKYWSEPKRHTEKTH